MARLAPEPPLKLVAVLVNEGLGNRLGLSCVVLRTPTGVVNVPMAFQVRLMLALEAVALTGEPGTFNAWARADATCAGESFTGWPLHTGLLLGPKQAVAVKLPTVKETVPESGTATCADPFKSCSDQPVLLLWRMS